MTFKQRLWHLIPPRVRELFEDGPEVIIESSLPPDVLSARIQDSLVNTWTWAPTGLCGSARHGRVRVGWRAGMSRMTSFPVFRGRIEVIGTSSVIIGRMSLHRFQRIFLGAWCGCLVCIAVLTIWTVVMPLVAWGLLWLLNGMLAVEQPSVQGWHESILDHLRSLARS